MARAGRSNPAQFGFLTDDTLASSRGGAQSSRIDFLSLAIRHSLCVNAQGKRRKVKKDVIKRQKSGETCIIPPPFIAFPA